MDIVPFEPQHIERLRSVPTQNQLGAMIDNPAYLQALSAGESWTAIDPARGVIGCGGLIAMWPGHWQAWALLAADIGGAGMLVMTRIVQRLMAAHVGRVEAIVAADFKAAHRWMCMLGFERETPGVMRKWFPDGSGAVLYSKVT